jgi:hypothetical protein
LRIIMKKIIGKKFSTLALNRPRKDTKKTNNISNVLQMSLFNVKYKKVGAVLENFI